MAGTGAASVAVLGKDKLEARFLSICMTAGLPEELMNKMGDNGLVSVALIANTFTSKEDCRDSFKDPPFDLNGTDLPTKLLLGKITSVYVAAGENSSVQVKADAERVLNNLPPQIPSQSVESLIKLFEANYKKI